MKLKSTEKFWEEIRSEIELEIESIEQAGYDETEPEFLEDQKNILKYQAMLEILKIPVPVIDMPDSYLPLLDNLLYWLETKFEYNAGDQWMVKEIKRVGIQMGVYKEMTPEQEARTFVSSGKKWAFKLDGKKWYFDKHLKDT